MARGEYEDVLNDNHRLIEMYNDRVRTLGVIITNLNRNIKSYEAEMWNPGSSAQERLQFLYKKLETEYSLQRYETENEKIHQIEPSTLRDHDTLSSIRAAQELSEMEQELMLTQFGKQAQQAGISAPDIAAHLEQMKRYFVLINRNNASQD